MTATEFTVGSPLPRIARVSAHDGFTVTVTWADGRTAAVDLAPAVLRYKVYAPLRTDPDLFASVRVTDDGFAVAWGDDIDMASTTIEDLASQVMTAADFGSFMKRHSYTLDGVAAELGVSRRLAAYYQSGRLIPRYIALACAYLDSRGALAKVTSDSTRERVAARMVELAEENLAMEVEAAFMAETRMSGK